jgi:uncharacterized protein
MVQDFQGKASCIERAMESCEDNNNPPFKVEASRFVADGDHVVVEAAGQNTTPDGETYNNKYCWVCHIAEGRLQSLHDYTDTELVTRTFGTDGK